MTSKAASVVARMQTDPEWTAREILGVELWSKQREILRSVWEHQRTAVRSCHGIGKTYTAAVVALCFLLAFKDSRVITTAPTWSQVENLLWREINALAARCKMPLGAEPNATKLQLGPEWFAIGLSTDRPERFQGHHAEHILLICDEASGIAQDIFDAAEGYLTSAFARMLLIGNPTQLSGEFYDAFHGLRHMYNTIGVSAYESPNITGEYVSEQVASKIVREEWVEDKRQKWPESSPQFQVRVLGQFPTTADDTIMSIADVEAAQDRALTTSGDGPKYIVVDVARFGSDETVFGLRDGWRFRILDTYIGKRTTHTAGRALELARLHKADAIIVDDSGVGGAVTDILTEQDEYDVKPFNGAESPVLAKDDYPNRRSEAWFALAEQLDRIALDSDAQLAGDLTAPKYALDSKARRVVEKKDETKKRLKRSPDRGDVAVMAFAPQRNTKPVTTRNVYSGGKHSGPKRKTIAERRREAYERDIADGV